MLILTPQDDASLTGFLAPVGFVGRFLILLVQRS